MTSSSAGTLRSHGSSTRSNHALAHKVGITPLLPVVEDLEVRDSDSITTMSPTVVSTSSASSPPGELTQSKTETKPRILVMRKRDVTDEFIREQVRETGGPVRVTGLEGDGGETDRVAVQLGCYGKAFGKKVGLPEEILETLRGPTNEGEPDLRPDVDPNGGRGNNNATTGRPMDDEQRPDGDAVREGDGSSIIIDLDLTNANNNTNSEHHTSYQTRSKGRPGGKRTDVKKVGIKISTPKSKGTKDRWDDPEDDGATDGSKESSLKKSKRQSESQRIRRAREKAQQKIREWTTRGAIAEKTGSENGPPPMSNQTDRPGANPNEERQQAGTSRPQDEQRMEVPEEVARTATDRPEESEAPRGDQAPAQGTDRADEANREGPADRAQGMEVDERAQPPHHDQRHQQDRREDDERSGQSVVDLVARNEHGQTNELGPIGEICDSEFVRGVSDAVNVRCAGPGGEAHDPEEDDMDTCNMEYVRLDFTLDETTEDPNITRVIEVKDIVNKNLDVGEGGKIRVGDVISMVVLKFNPQTDKSWAVPGPELFRELANRVHVYCIEHDLACARAYRWGTLWGRVGLFGLASKNLEDINGFRRAVENQISDHTQFTLFPKDAIQRRGNLSVLLRDNFWSFNVDWLPRAILMRTRMRGGLRNTHIKHYASDDFTRDGVCKAGWRLVLMQGCPELMKSLEKYDHDHRFPVGAGHIIIRGGQGRPRGTVPRRGRGVRGGGDPRRERQQQQQLPQRDRPRDRPWQQQGRARSRDDQRRSDDREGDYDGRGQSRQQHRDQQSRKDHQNHEEEDDYDEHFPDWDLSLIHI